MAFQKALGEAGQAGGGVVDLPAGHYRINGGLSVPAGQFTASACNFVNWDNRGEGSPAIQLDAGKAIVQGCSCRKR